jgi:5-methylcytosine-specific restriction endonuclease McrA
MASASPEPSYPAWRWDQGRLEYLRIEHIGRFSSALCNASGLDASSDDPAIRTRFYSETGLPFKPTTYTLWRNYGRVFKLLLLAQASKGRLEATALARTIHSASTKQVDSDRYLEQIFSLTRFPSPAFEDYRATTSPVRPFVAVLRLLAVHPSFKIGIAAEDVCRYLVGNQILGNESDAALAKLKPTSATSQVDTRQVREMLRFLGQHSALIWMNKRLTPDGLRSLRTLISQVCERGVPNMKADAEDEIRSLASNAVGSGGHSNVWGPRSTRLPEGADKGVAFLEGTRRFTQHHRIERNRLLRKHVLRTAKRVAGAQPLACDCCGLVPQHQYPWSSEALLEVHHVLPLASPVRLSRNETTVEGVVLICPTCHRAVHSRYRIYLTERSLNDFASEEEALGLYQAIRKETSAR